MKTSTRRRPQAGPVLVIVERRGGSVAKASLEALGQAALLAQKTGSLVWAVDFGAPSKSVAGCLGGYGARRISCCDYDEVFTRGASVFVRVMESVVRRIKPYAVVMAATHWGQERCARLAAALGKGLASSAVAWDWTPGGMRAVRAVYGGRLSEQIAFTGDEPYLLTLRPNLFPPIRDAAARAPQTETLTLPKYDAAAATLLEAVADAARETPLAEAEVVVTGGGGMGGPENFGILYELANALGGVVGASRAAVDAGWMPLERQVGQTGTVVAPKLYVACGVSGAVQHRAGIRKARFITAINNDPAAPIFRYADSGIVGDLFEVVPLLTRAVSRRRSEVV
ncbi:MAG: electron transfer flavoprotein subunit alpha/FixB family protein [Elusimicrobiota bacterium]